MNIIFSGNAVPTGAVCSIAFHTDTTEFLQATFQQVADLLKPVHDACSTDNTLMDRAELKVGPTEIGPTLVYTLNKPGGRGPGACPPNVSVLVAKQVQGLSAKFGGRLFWPGVHEASTTDAGSLQTPYQTSMQTAWDTFFTGAKAAGWDPIVIHGPKPATPDWTLCNAFRVDSRVATQRHRLRR